jgi:hypothetical protein
MWRAVILASTACGALVASINIIFDLAGQWGWTRLPMHLAFASGVAVLVGLAGIVVQWPILRAMRSLRRSIVLCAGALLAAVPFAALLAIFWQRGEDTVAGLISFWVRVPGEFLFGFAPMALAGGLLAWFASAPQSATR